MTTLFAPPRFATRRSPDLRSQGRAVAKVGRALGTPLLPWQRYVADVATEITPAGRYRYPIVVLTVPRQAGKTVLVRCVGVHRATIMPRRPVYYTAQTGKDARKRWLDMMDAVEESPFGELCTKRLSAGSEALILPNRSSFGPFAPTHDALHGETPPLVMIDEAWAHGVELGEALMGAIRPAQITLPERQLWIVSAAGNAESTWFRAWVEVGRAAVSDPAANIAYFEWSAADDAPRDDPAMWAGFHPAYGELITEQDLRENLTLADFDRAYLNRWPSLNAGALIPLSTFEARYDAEQTMPEPGALSFGFDVGEDRRDAAIVAAWHDRHGIARNAVIERAPGASWLAPRLRELRDRWKPRAVGYDDHGPAVAVADDLTRDGFDVEPVSGRDYSTACGTWLARVMDAGMLHNAKPGSPLHASAEHARARRIGDVWVWDRRDPPEDATPTAVIAGTVASWVHDHTPEPIPDEPMRIHS